MDDVAVDELALGRPPRPPRRRPSRGVRLAVGAVGAVGVVALAAGVTARHLTAPHPSAPPPGATFAAAGDRTADAAPSVAVISDVCRLVTLDGLPSTVLDADPATVADLRGRVPGLADVRGGRPATADSRYGLVLVASFTTAGGPATLTLWTERAAGTARSVDRSVARTRFDRSYTVTTGVVATTGTGWRVHALAVAPDTPSASARVATGDVLAGVVLDPELVR